jgi:3-hydroxybutyryl-CoA dehydratase
MKQGEIFEKYFDVTPEVYKAFTDIFNDKNPLHTDELYAKSKGFDSMVMHGNILGGFLSYFIGECLPEKNVIIHSQSIKYRRPVYLNDRLKLTGYVEGVYESVKTIEIKFSFLNQNNIKVASGTIQISNI